ncbi:MAG: hypothetical protein H6736_05335 [Alphaproteobacteria bacterium]|nr:hypothetical protein [Alphaproteobacteria bacterium]MCB9691221.1 hypothetical protein [Alphaproteobacteria bacterium]
MELEGHEALAVGLSACGRGAALVTGQAVVGVWEGRSWEVPLASGAGRAFTTHGVVWGPDGLVAASSVGRIVVLDGRTGQELARMGRQASTSLVRRGLLARDRLVLDEGIARIVDPASGTVHLEMRPDVSFMGAQNAAVVDPTGTWLAVGGSEGMDAGWTERFDLRTGASVARGGSGYTIDAVELDPEGGILFLDDYLGLSGFRGERVRGNDLWLAGNVLYVASSTGVLRMEEDGPSESWAIGWPGSLSVADDGQVAVVADRKARFHTF